jgi:hypothetical protein
LKLSEIGGLYISRAVYSRPVSRPTFAHDLWKLSGTMHIMCNIAHDELIIDSRLLPSENTGSQAFWPDCDDDPTIIIGSRLSHFIAKDLDPLYLKLVNLHITITFNTDSLQ